jgi:hypothetical protein
LEWTNPACPFVHKFYDSDEVQKLQKSATDKGVVWLRINSSCSRNMKALRRPRKPQPTKKAICRLHGDGVGSVWKKSALFSTGSRAGYGSMPPYLKLCASSSPKTIRKAIGFLGELFYYNDANKMTASQVRLAMAAMGQKRTGYLPGRGSTGNPQGPEAGSAQ